MLGGTGGGPPPFQHFLSEAHAAPASGVTSLAPATVMPEKPTRSTTPSTDPQTIRALPGPDGPMAALLDDYELLGPQLRMPPAIAQLYARDGRLLSHAGPGTGNMYDDLGTE